MKQKQNLYPILAVIVGLFLSGLYLNYILNNVNDKTWDTATNYVTTLLSIVVGANISILIYNHQKEQQSEQKLKELRASLERELSDLNRILTTGESITVNNLSFLSTYIQPIIIDECAKSGLFETKEVENLLHMSRKIKFYNVQVSYFLSILINSNNNNFSDILNNCNRNMETSRNAIINNINMIITQFDLTKSDSINYD